MDPLETAVVDITRLIACGRALRNADASAIAGKAIRGRRRLRAELRRAAAAYLKTLARAPDGVLNETTLSKCRVAAERGMPTGVASVEALAALMERGIGSLDGLATTRHDLWRLSHMAVHLREGAALLGKMQSKADHKSTRKVAKPLQKEFRRAMVAYATTAMKEGGDSRTCVRGARAAAIAGLSARCVDVADQLAWLEGEFAQAPKLLEDGVAQPLRHLLTDWTET